MRVGVRAVVGVRMGLGLALALRLRLGRGLRGRGRARVTKRARVGFGLALALELGLGLGLETGGESGGWAWGGRGESGGRVRFSIMPVPSSRSTRERALSISRAQFKCMKCGHVRFFPVTYTAHSCVQSPSMHIGHSARLSSGASTLSACSRWEPNLRVAA